MKYNIRKVEFMYAGMIKIFGIMQWIHKSNFGLNIIKIKYKFQGQILYQSMFIKKLINKKTAPDGCISWVSGCHEDFMPHSMAMKSTLSVSLE